MPRPANLIEVRTGPMRSRLAPADETRQSHRHATSHGWGDVPTVGTSHCTPTGMTESATPVFGPVLDKTPAGVRPAADVFRDMDARIALFRARYLRGEPVTRKDDHEAAALEPPPDPAAVPAWVAATAVQGHFDAARFARWWEEQDDATRAYLTGLPRPCIMERYERSGCRKYRDNARRTRKKAGLPTVGTTYRKKASHAEAEAA
jgi:hypothetical protein